MSLAVDSRAPSRPAPWLAIAVVAVLAFALRLLACRAMSANLSRDDDSYRAIAERVRSEGRFARELPGREPAVTAYRPPLYPLLLVGLSPWAPASRQTIAWSNAALGAATTAFVAWIASRVARDGSFATDQRLAFVAGGLVAVDPLLLHNATLAMTESLAAMLAAGSIAVLARFVERPGVPWAIAAGAAMGLGALCRPIFLPWAALVVVIVGVSPIEGRRRFGAAAAIALAVALVVAPWAFRNWQVFGRPIVATTHGGYTLMLGNNPHFYSHLRTRGWFAPWDDREFHRAWANRFPTTTAEEFAWSAPDATREPPPTPGDFDELADDQLAQSLARKAMAADRAGFWQATAYRLFQLVNPLPNATEEDESTRRKAARWAVGLWNAAILFVAVLGFVRLWRSFDASDSRSARRILLAAAFSLALALFAVHATYWSNLRMRAPLLPAIGLMAAIGVCRPGASRMSPHGALS